MRGQNTRMWLLVACAGAMLVAGGGTNAIAAETHQFDPTLSLTGACGTSELDPIPDPGLCPMPPGVAGVDHPTAAFNNPGGVTTDSYGNIYVASAVGSASGRIDVFDSSGLFITTIEDPDVPEALVVDSKGHLYVSHIGSDAEYGVVRYDPTAYEPGSGEIQYASSSTGVVDVYGAFHGLALDPATDRLFVKFSDHVGVYKSAAEGNELIEEFGFGLIAGASTEPVGLAMDQIRNRLYVGGANNSDCLCVYVLSLAPPHDVLFTIKGSAVPAGKFFGAALSLAVDEGTGHLFVYDGAAAKVYEFDQSGTYVRTIEHRFGYVYGSEIGIDNGAHSPNGGLNPKGRYLFVPSSSDEKGGGTGHSYAFGPQNICEPIVESVSFADAGEGEAELRAEIEPCSLSTHYVFEFLTQQQFVEGGGSFAGARIAGERDIPAGAALVPVSAVATGLSPGTVYRFRVVATNEEGSDEGQGVFATYPAGEGRPPCPNDPLRTGIAALLPDCRAYELVTPPSTNARAPLGAGATLGTFFAAPQASPAGDKVSFRIEGGSFAGAEAVGSFAGDPYLASRSEAGWSTSYTGPNGFEVTSLLPASNSPDQGYSFWTAEGEGSALIAGQSTNYVRYPDGHSELVGRGSLGTDPQARGKLISTDGGHIIFFSADAGGHPAVQLEPGAPPKGTQAIYDRTGDEVTHVVSLLPGNETPKPDEDALYVGASLDGRGVAFSIGSTLYLRYDNSETYEIGKNVTFSGVAEGGARIFYLEGGKLWRFDATTGQRVAFNSSGTAVPVNVSADGSTAYFVSPTALPGLENPNGAQPVKGGENLYRSEEGAIGFVGIVTERDVVGEPGNFPMGGLGLWTEAVGTGQLAIDPSRTTPDGAVLLFESRAPLDGYDSEGHAEVYRYDSVGNQLDCLSCNPTLAPAGGEASLQSIGIEPGDPEPLGPFALLANLSPDGRRAFFQSTEALVPSDTDGLQDVYEWEAQGIGSCARAGGCVFLISSGHSRRVDYIYAVSDSGDDVFFRTSNILLPSDLEETASIYDARVNGGFAEKVGPICEGEGCRPALSVPPPSLAVESGVHLPGRRGVRCRKRTRKVRRHGKVRCVKKHRRQHHRHHRKAGSKKKGARK